MTGTNSEVRTARPIVSIQNNCTNLCVYNGLDCLTVANCTTAAQRFFPALSHRTNARVRLSLRARRRRAPASWTTPDRDMKAHDRPQRRSSRPPRDWRNAAAVQRACAMAGRRSPASSIRHHAHSLAGAMARARQRNGGAIYRLTARLGEVEALDHVCVERAIAASSESESAT